MPSQLRFASSTRNLAFFAKGFTTRKQQTPGGRNFVSRLEYLTDVAFVFCHLKKKTDTKQLLRTMVAGLPVTDPLVLIWEVSILDLYQFILPLLNLF